MHTRALTPLGTQAHCSSTHAAGVPCAQAMPTERYESARSMGAARTLGSAHAGDVQPASFQLTAETVARVQRSADLRKSAALGGMPNGRVLVGNRGG